MPRPRPRDPPLQAAQINDARPAALYKPLVDILVTLRRFAGPPVPAP